MTENSSCLELECLGEHSLQVHAKELCMVIEVFYNTIVVMVT